MKKKIVIKVNSAGQIRSNANFDDTELQEKYLNRLLRSKKYIKLNRRTRFIRAVRKGLSEFCKRTVFIARTIHIGFSKPEIERRRYVEEIRGRL